MEVYMEDREQTQKYRMDATSMTSEAGHRAA
jgi:hypothetical protein